MTAEASFLSRSAAPEPCCLRFRSGSTAVLLFFCLVACFPLLAAGGQTTPAAAPEPQTAPASPYAGSDTCMGCHEDIYKSFLKSSRHASLDTNKSKGWATKACESCHGPGAKHAETAEPANIRNPKKLTVAEIDKTCLGCHSNQPTHVGRVMSGHARNQVACTSCHSIHTPPAAGPRAARISEQCAGCHIDVRASFQKPHAHQLAQRTQPNLPMTCTDCHNPHGTFLAKNLATTIGGEPGCLRCHSDKRGPFAYEHAPVRLEGCQSCHEPHGSANPRMLTRNNVSQQCLECHSNLVAGSALGSVPPAFHDLRSARFRNCTICHQKIHGSHVNKALLR